MLYSWLVVAVTKMTPRPSLIPDIGEQVSDVMTSSTTPPVSTPTSTQHGTGTGGTTTTTSTTSSSTNKSEPGKPPSRAGACRVCLKAFKPDDFSRTCSECTQRVCEDCASYSKLDANEDQVSFLLPLLCPAISGFVSTYILFILFKNTYLMIFIRLRANLSNGLTYESFLKNYSRS